VKALIVVALSMLVSVGSYWALASQLERNRRRRNPDKPFIARSNFFLAGAPSAHSGLPYLFLFVLSLSVLGISGGVVAVKRMNDCTIPSPRVSWSNVSEKYTSLRLSIGTPR